MLVAAAAIAQERTVTGTVTSAEDGLPLPGVSVSVKGTTVGTQTNGNGQFSLKVSSPNPILVFSFIGTATQELAVPASNVLNVRLAADAALLSEVVVTGYTVQNKRDATSSIGRIGEDQIVNTPVVDPNDLLKGRVTGVVATTGSGQPGAVQSVRIRGINSISSGNEPLYVIDGVIIARGTFNGVNLDPDDENRDNQVMPTDVLSNLNPNDIESMNVLKDASAIALYGARGANGVIVITTKKGSSGKTEFNLRTQYGSTKANFGNFKLMNAEQFINYETLALVNAGEDPADIPSYLEALGGNVDFDWQNAAFRTGVSTQTDISARGGNDNTRYYFSAGIGKQDGTLIGSSLKKYSILSNIDQKINDRFSVGLNLNLTYSDGMTAADGGRFASPILGYMATAPIQSPYDANGELYSGMEGGWFGLTGDNFLYNTQYNFNNNRNYRTLGRLNGEYKVFDWLKVSQNLAIDWVDARQKLFQDARTPDGIGSNGSLTDAANESKLYTTQTSLSGNYSPSTEHSLSYLAMLEYTFKDFQTLQASGKSILSNERFKSLNSAILPVSVGGSSSTQAILSYIGNVAYSYKSRYNLNLSLRRDEASNFTKNKAETFYAIGAAWRLIEEDFMKNQNLFSNAKLRASYGTSGNLNGLSDFIAYTLWQPVNYNDLAGIAPFQLGNDDLRWEKTKSFDIGLELGFLNNRLNVEVDYYSKNTDQQLFRLPISSTTGFLTMPINLGEVQNNGFEFSVNSLNIDKNDFKWRTNFNFSYNKNKVLETKDNQDLISGIKIVREGNSIGTYYMREWAGVDASNGDPLWYLADGTTTNVYNNAERRLLGQALPKFTYGMNNDLTYKSFGLSFLLYAATGNLIYNQTASYLENTAYINSGFNHLVSASEDFWTTPGVSAKRPLPIAGGNKNESSASSRFLEKGDYLRLKNVRLSYSLPVNVLSKTGLNRVTVFGQGQNLFTWTNYSGIDPEVDADGTEFFKYPVGKIFTFGLDVTF